MTTRTSKSDGSSPASQQDLKQSGVRRIEVKNPKDFAALFEPKANDCLLLCYERGELSSASREEIASSLTACIKKHSGGTPMKSSALVDYAEWDCTQYADARAQIEKRPEELLLLVVFNHSLADAVRQPLRKEAGGERAGVTAFISSVGAMIGRIAQFKGSKSAASVPARTETADAASGQAPNSMQVDIVKLMNLGQKLLTTGQPAYAAKCFERALGVLDAVQGELESAAAVVEAEEAEEQKKKDAETVHSGSTESQESVAPKASQLHSETASESLDSLLRTTVDCLAWAAFAQCVQNQDVLHNAHVIRLESDPKLNSFCKEPLSQGSRIIAFKTMCRAAPFSWNSETHTPKKLRELLEKDPQNDKQRSMLVLSLFLTGDLEHALTEAIKLKVRNVEFGRVAVDAMVGFLGPRHPLSAAVGTSA